jgi:predicted Zn-dependent protease
MNLLRIICTAIAILSIGLVFAQVDFNNYTTLLAKGPIPVDFTKETFTKVQEELKTGREELNKSQEKVFLEGTNYAIDEILHSGMVVYGDEISNYISAVADKLLRNNGELRSKLRFYTIKSNTANAFSTDQGIVFVTTGLISQFTSEAQLAYVLAHEISHYTEKHVIETFDWKTDGNHKNDRIEHLSQYSKEKEFEADKIGLKIYFEAGYSPNEVISTFDVLMYSYLPFDEVEFPSTYFNSSNLFVPEGLFPTKKYPIKAVEDYDDQNSSHPNIKKRKDAVEKEIGSFSNWGSETQFFGEDRFKEIRNIARFERIRSDILDAQFADALYSVFLLEREFPSSIYLSRMKAHIWMNMMLYKTGNISLKMVDKTSELEGESAAVHLFLKKLTKDGLTTIALRQVYDIHKAFPEDEEITAVYKRLVKDLSEVAKFKVENYSKKNFQQASEDFLKAKNDTLKPAVKDSVQNSGSKYDKIKKKQNADTPENFDSTKFYLYGIADIINDSEFSELNSTYKKIAIEKEKELEAYNALSNKQQRAYDKKKSLEVEKLTEKELIVVEPMVISYKRGEINYVKSEKLEKDFSAVIEESAKNVGITTYSIDSRSLTDKGTQGFNERSILISLLNQLAQEENVNTFPVDFQLLKNIQSDYGTSKVLFSLVEHSYSPNITFQAIFSAAFLYPVLMIYLPVTLFSGNHTEISVLVLDMESGKVHGTVNYYFKDTPKKLQLSAHMYDIFYKLTKEAK